MEKLNTHQVKALYGFIKTQALINEAKSEERKAFASYIWAKNLDPESVNSAKSRVIRILANIKDLEKALVVKEARLKSLVKDYKDILNKAFEVPAKIFKPSSLNNRNNDAYELYGSYHITNSSTTRRNKYNRKR